LIMRVRRFWTESVEFQSVEIMSSISSVGSRVWLVGLV
jgi:hypothetical protein